MNAVFTRLSCSLVLATVSFGSSSAAEVDARPPDRLTLSGYNSTFRDSDAEGGGGSLSWLHYVSPDALFGVGADHQFIEEATLTYGSLRGSVGRGEPKSRFNLVAEIYYGEGDDDGRSFDYAVGVLGISQAFTPRFSVQLEARQIDIDKSRGNLPKLGISFLWTPRLLTNVSYAQSVGGNLGTELTAARVDYYGRYLNVLAGGSTGRADPSVLVLQPGVTLPATQSKQGFLGFGKTFRRGELQLIGDVLEVGDVEKVTVTLSFTAYLGSRVRAP